MPKLCCVHGEEEHLAVQKGERGGILSGKGPRIDLYFEEGISELLDHEESLRIGKN